MLRVHYLIKEADAPHAVAPAERKALLSDEDCARTAAHLREARSMYVLGIEEVAAALRKIDPQGRTAH